MKNSTVLLLVFAFLLTSVSQIWSTLPCAPKCSFEEMSNHLASPGKTSETHHQHLMMTDSEENKGCNGCEKCEDFYNILFSSLPFTEHLSPAISYPTNLNASIPEKSNRIPDPYLTPPA